MSVNIEIQRNYLFTFLNECAIACIYYEWHFHQLTADSSKFKKKCNNKKKKSEYLINNTKCSPSMHHPSNHRVVFVTDKLQQVAYTQGCSKVGNVTVCWLNCTQQAMDQS